MGTMRTSCWKSSMSSAVVTASTLVTRVAVVRSTTFSSSSALKSSRIELKRKRSNCASGSGYVPSSSIGFCVASTKNGAGSR